MRNFLIMLLTATALSAADPAKSPEPPKVTITDAQRADYWQKFSDMQGLQTQLMASQNAVQDVVKSLREVCAKFDMDLTQRQDKQPDCVPRATAAKVEPKKP